MLFFLKMLFFLLRSLNDVSKSSNSDERSKQTRSEKARANFRCLLLFISYKKYSIN
jgi:hypothetical protein